MIVMVIFPSLKRTESERQKVLRFPNHGDRIASRNPGTRDFEGGRRLLNGGRRFVFAIGKLDGMSRSSKEKSGGARSRIPE
jgi:hypothetical protein